MRFSTFKIPLLLILLLFGSSAQAGTLSVIRSDRWVTVARVFDGDTFTTTSGERVRLLGINTPEIAHGQQPAQPMGHEARQRLNTMIQGQTVRLAFDRDKFDDYGRTLAQVYLRNGLWVNADLVQKGFAHVYTFAPNFRWSRELIVAEQHARKAGTGIWRTNRFRVLPAEQAGADQIGQFRVIRGQVSHIEPWGFRLARLRITIPVRYRQWFKQPTPVTPEQIVLVRGIIRLSRSGTYDLALHSPFDME
ncbi:thermonuclease family protein [Mariprofundus erugo]|uniref:Thermonuclease family protein n=1 Tax=Mariprofundus erugo TaxID=2528639 RepID=A0A5R9GZW8_9PROT|nr:thermonuclease family protein [Mariprofundus erugo]TLS69202.1 thermonuclease family protein [Mariprofundus erugo]TLS75036.1 thermonuclease family protein [Mariprofundus erugo]